VKIPATLPAESITALIDTREQRPLDLSPLRSVVGTLDTGDYSDVGLEHVIRIERKSLSDLIGCVGRERGRFDREVMRLIAYPVRVLVVESTWPEIEQGEWRGQITPSQAIGALLGWQASGLAVHMVGDHRRAGTHVARLLHCVARRRYRELRTFVAGMDATQRT
jgi:ERCC4-type nuclease